MLASAHLHTFDLATSLEKKAGLSGLFQGGIRAPTEYSLLIIINCKT